ncbi:hypothetical protein SD81_032425 [Tolypothrix campylonemoides VB511288]|nr:hypothetical protein SD81_032425 [Tolypothrix campylonemoides VB511288]
MPYTVDIVERDFTGPRLQNALSGETFATLLEASSAAKSEAFYLSNALGVPIAVMIHEDERTLIRHIVPALHDEARTPLYPRSIDDGLGPARPS